MDLRFLEPLYRASGPVASVYLDTTRTAEDAAHRIAPRWRGLRKELAESGADEATLEALDSAAGGIDGIPGPQGEALFASGGELIAAYTLSVPPSRDRAALMPVPEPVELVCDLDDGLPYVVVAVDREGADIYAYPAYGDLSEERHTSGATLHINKVPHGGWRQKHRRRHTEEVWFANAAQVASDIEEAVKRVQAAAVFVGGDERALGKLRQYLGHRTAEMLIEISGGGRGDPDAIAELRKSVEEGLRRTAVALRSGLMEDFRQDLGRDGRAVQGMSATCEALRSGRVGRLMISDDRTGERNLWASATDPLELSDDRARLTDPAEAFEAPAGSLLLRAAQATSASFSRLPDEGDAQDGVGAFLRLTGA
ncbi:baeRF2 domain-containing protein [Streptomonospora wellingtoniae]|uniref:Vms1/Ankzf1 family peptidyl-tRNA hydrolase n=1 Tax=Streptomonospora wellingtoniae TaxID=3075544 RepID=A0ABU2L0R2_9ACTN|nr:Vms1/Ankzf1 family peptidyl-tRNA hydrolase [Streptomonospora sp. DSM 45055]MDT0305140.1 Vms1/Ankzf1 family peptidyl-tRNA hydrolase [Streptomonospora sp. DSM 45055]